MHTTQELTTILGLSRKQLRTRLDALARAGLLGGHQVKTGAHGRQVFEHGVLVTLKELDQLARDGGHQLNTAAHLLARQIRGDVQEPTNGQGADKGQGAHLEALVEQLRQENAFLRSQLDRLTAAIVVPGLPSPRPWWRRLLPQRP